MSDKSFARARLAALAAAGLLLAQTGTPSYNLGVPAVPGTRVPENNPATAMPSPQSSETGATAPTPGASAVPTQSPGAASGPGYAFGAAPPPITSPSR
jgi:hypothetical protein